MSNVVLRADKNLEKLPIDRTALGGLRRVLVRLSGRDGHDRRDLEVVLVPTESGKQWHLHIHDMVEVRRLRACGRLSKRGTEYRGSYHGMVWQSYYKRVDSSEHRYSRAMQLVTPPANNTREADQRLRALLESEGYEVRGLRGL